MLGKYRLWAVCFAFSFGVSSETVFAEYLIPLEDDRSLTMGAAARVELSIEELAASNSMDDSFDFEMVDARIFAVAEINDHARIKVAFGFDGDKDDPEVQLLDAVLQYSFSEQFNLWLGRSIMPVDRVTLSDEYYLGIWEAPIASGVLEADSGRDDGAVFWGEVDGGGFKYYLGVYEGFSTSEGTEDNPLMVGRVVLNFWDEEPGYFLRSSYLGEKDVFALGVSWLFQKEAFYNGEVEGDYWALAVDFLMEKSVANRGVITLEAALYDYDADNLTTLDGPEFQNRLEGDGYFVFLGFLFSQTKGPSAVGIQPLIRYHRFRLGQSEIDENIAVIDYGISYFMAGQHSKFILVYSDYEVDKDGDVAEHSEIKMGAQLMY